MSERVRRLEALLERVRVNAQKPRTLVSVGPATASESVLRSVATAPFDGDDEAEPVPLVRVTAVAQPVIAEEEQSFTPFSMTDEVTTLELVENELPEQLTEGDLEDLSSELLDSVPPPEVVWSSASGPPLVIDEEAPASSQRPRTSAELEGDLTGREESITAEERPLMTPPPKSGPQIAPPGMFSGEPPEVENLRAEGPPLSQRDFGPTPEQIGESVDLGEARGPELELDTVSAHSTANEPSEELEALLHAPPNVGIYDDDLLPPPEAREELDAHVRRLSTPGSDSRFSAEAQAFPSEAQVAPFVPPSAVEGTGLAAPEVFTPALPSGGAPELRLAPVTFRPATFLELLDASLGLRG